MIVSFIILIIVAIKILICNIMQGGMNAFFNGMVFGYCIILAIITGCEIWCKPKPNAIDVYRNKTTLQITYQDSVAIDSVVVFKNMEE